MEDDKLFIFNNRLLKMKLNCVIPNFATGNLKIHTRVQYFINDYWEKKRKRI
jgi:hypothetical protein